MKTEKWNAGWKYWIDQDSFALLWTIPEDAAEVTLPHDAMLESRPYAQSSNGGSTGYRDGAVYQYVKFLTVPTDCQEQTFFLKFEGVYQNAFVYVNQQLAGKCPYGYTGFYVPLNDFLRGGEANEIRVIVHNSAASNSRWYSGGGIYRDVCLLQASPVYLKPEGVQITTEDLTEDLAILQIASSLQNRNCRREELYLETTILDQNGTSVGYDRIPVTLSAGEYRRMSQRLAIRNPLPWSDRFPALSTCISRLYRGETLLDENRTTFGIRKLTVDSVRGLLVNGKSVKLRGACIHHDNGFLGAATYYEAEYRRILFLKKAGFNAIRMSHHPAAPALLRACDELGMYVMDETFDMWTRCKSDNDYGLFFSEWWEKDVDAMIRKDYNHPSVILYSVGNEIPEIGTDHGAKICHDICSRIKALDMTRPTLASINGVFAAGDALSIILKDLKASGKVQGNVNDFMTIMDSHMDQIVVHEEISKRLEKACANTDIAGYNYMTARYEKDGQAYPNRVIVGSETYPPEIARNWGLVKKYPHVIGDFTWTGWDYIGEAGIGIPAYRFGEGGFGAQFPCQLAYCGDFDITGFRRPASYYREIVFGCRKDPYIAIRNPYRYGQKLLKTPWVISDSLSSWTYPGLEGKKVIAEIYGAGEETELFLNGRSLGRKTSGEQAGFTVSFELIYEPGILKAVSYEGGREIGCMELKTAVGAERLILRPESHYGKDTFDENLLYVTIVNEAENGVCVTDHEVKLKARIQGAVILGFGSADPKTAYSYQTEETETFHGRALLILQRQAGCSWKNVCVKIATDTAEYELLPGREISTADSYQ